MNLSDAVAGERRRNRRRVGRGSGSGWGKTCGKGHRGARTRSSASQAISVTFEGGQMPLFRRLPKRGFNNRRFQKRPAVVNLADLADWPGEEAVTPDSLLAAGLVKSIANGVKVLGRGDVSRPLTVKAHAFSQAAREKVLAAGGKVEEIR